MELFALLIVTFLFIGYCVWAVDEFKRRKHDKS